MDEIRRYIDRSFSSFVTVNNLSPEITNIVKSLIGVCKLNGLDIYVISGYRSIEEQNKIYAQGRTRPGDIVTKARGGHSWHNFGLAVDFGFYSKPAKWDDLGEHGRRLGLEWGGSWGSKFVDKPHFQLTRGLKLREARELLDRCGLSAVWEEVKRRKNHE